MSGWFPETRAASSRLWFNLRCLWCEIVFGLAMWICPEKYCPSYIEAVIEAMEDE